MQLTINRKALCTELSLVNRAGDPRSGCPILSCVLLSATSLDLTLECTDLEIALRSSLSLEDESPGEICVPAKRLLAYLNALDGDDVTLSAKDGWLTVQSGRAKTRIPGMTRDNWPAIEPVSGSAIQVGGKSLAGLIARTSFAVSDEESRYTLNGALLAIKDGHAELVATDGHRLALATAEQAGQFNALIPKKALNILAGLCADEPIGVSRDDTNLQFNSGSRTLTSRVLTGTFPAYQAVLPKDQPIIFSVNRLAFLSAVRRTGMFADERSHAVKLALDGHSSVTVLGSSSDQGEASDTVELEYSPISEKAELQIGFNATYLVDVLTALSTDQVDILLKDGESAGEIRPTGDATYRHILMPMRT